MKNMMNEFWEIIKKGIPNGITVSRIIACTLAAANFVLGNYIAAVCLYVYGGISDAIDGFVARKLNACSNLGRLLDAISDKWFAVMLCAPGIAMGNLLMIIPLVLETMIAWVTKNNLLDNKNPRTERIGKLKTILLFPAMILGLMATLNLGIYFVFAPIFALAVSLQVKSFITYKNQKYVKDEEIDIRPILPSSEMMEKTKSKGNCKIMDITKEKDVLMNFKSSLQRLAKDCDYISKEMYYYLFFDNSEMRNEQDNGYVRERKRV